MSNHTESPVRVLRSSGAKTASLEAQLTRLRSDLDHLKTESNSWVKTWGVYLGILGALIAVPKEALDLVSELWHRADTSVAIREITIYHAPELSSEIVTFPMVVMNVGNRDDVLFNNGASLTVEGQSVELSNDDFGLFDDGKKIDTSLLIPKDTLACTSSKCVSWGLSINRIPPLSVFHCKQAMSMTFLNRTKFDGKR